MYCLSPQFLPPANEVWGKLMFSQVFVCPPGRGVCVPACITGHMTGGVSVPAFITGHMTGRVSIQGGLSKGLSVQGGGSLLSKGGLCRGDPPHTVMSGRYASYSNAFLVVLPISVSKETMPYRIHLKQIRPCSQHTLIKEAKYVDNE